MKTSPITAIFGTCALALALGAAGTASAHDHADGTVRLAQAGQGGGGQQQQQQQAQAQQQQQQQAGAGMSIVGMEIRDNAGEALGEVANVMVNQKGQIQSVVLETAGVLGVGSEDYVVPWQRLSIQQGGQFASVNVTQDQLDAEFARFEEGMSMPGMQQQGGGQQQQGGGGQQQQGGGQQQ